LQKKGVGGLRGAANAFGTVRKEKLVYIEEKTSMKVVYFYGGIGRIATSLLRKYIEER
jgi:hypothetical protein